MNVELLPEGPKVEESAAPRSLLNYGPFAAITVAVTSFFGSQLLAGVALALLPSLLGWDEARIQQWFDSSMLPQAIIIGLSGVIGIVLIRLFLHSRGNRLLQLGLAPPKLAIIWQAVAGFFVYLVSYLLVVAAAKTLIPALNLEQEQDLGFEIGAGSNILLLVFTLVVVPPIVEEIVMRGFLFGGLRNKVSFLPAALVTSTLFAAAHLPGGKDGLLWVGAIDTFVLSVVLCYMREKTGNLWPCIAVHAIKNGLALVYLVHLG